MLIALIWKFDFSPFMVLIIAILNDGKFTELQITGFLFLHFFFFYFIPNHIHQYDLQDFFVHNLLDKGTIMTISKDRVKASPMPDSWKLKEIFATGIVFGGYLALMTVIFFWAMKDTHFFSVSICFTFLVKEGFW